MFKKIKVLRIINFLVITLCFSLLFVSVKVNAADLYVYNGKVEYSYNGIDGGEPVDVTDGTYGASVDLVAKPAEGNRFLYWTNHNKVISSEDHFTMIFYGGENVSAVFTNDRRRAIIYIDANNDLLGMKFYGTDLGGQQGEIGEIQSPVKLGYTFDGWLEPTESPLNDIFIRATYTVDSEINQVLPEEAVNGFKFGYCLTQEKLALIVDVDVDGDIVEMGVIYNTAGDPMEATSSKIVKALRYSSDYEFSVHLAMNHDGDEVYAYAYAVTKSDESYTTQYSDLLTIKRNPTITYDLKEASAHFVARNTTVADFMTDFNRVNVSTTEVAGIYGAGDIAQYDFWKSEEALKNWGYLLTYFLSFYAEGSDQAKFYSRIIADPLETEASYNIVSLDLQGFLNKTHYTDLGSNSSIDFTILSNAYHYNIANQIKDKLYDGVHPEPWKMGYTFVGWIDTYENPAIVPIIANMTLNPLWTINQYEISFNSNGGSAVNAITQDFNTAVMAPSAPIKTGYTFGGWYSDVGLLVSYEFTTMPAASITLYAKWIINQYTLSFNSNGGSAVSSITRDYNTAVMAPSAPIKTGFIFSGWYRDKNFTFEFTFPTTMPAADTWLYARWQRGEDITVQAYDIEEFNSSYSPAGYVNLDSNSLPNDVANWYRIILGAGPNEWTFVVRAVLPAGTANPAWTENDLYSIYVHIGHSQYATISARGIIVGDVILFKAADFPPHSGIVDIPTMIFVN